MKPPLRCKEVIARLREGESVIVSESRGESLRWAARELGCTVKTKRLTVGGGRVRVTLMSLPTLKARAA